MKKKYKTTNQFDAMQSIRKKTCKPGVVIPDKKKQKLEKIRRNECE